jgi:hypothetical protein
MEEYKMARKTLSMGFLLLATLFGSRYPLQAKPQTAAEHNQPAHAAPSNVVTCRIMEVHANKDPGVVLVIFHQRDKQDQPRFAALLKQSSGGTIQIRPAGAQWQSAAVIRLKSCFGRGMLILPAGTTSLRERADLTVKFQDSKTAQ